MRERERESERGRWRKNRGGKGRKEEEVRIKGGERSSLEGTTTEGVGVVPASIERRWRMEVTAELGTAMMVAMLDGKCEGKERRWRWLRTMSGDDGFRLRLRERDSGGDGDADVLPRRWRWPVVATEATTFSRSWRRTVDDGNDGDDTTVALRTSHRVRWPEFTGVVLYFFLSIFLLYC